MRKIILVSLCTLFAIDGYALESGIKQCPVYMDSHDFSPYISILPSEQWNTVNYNDQHGIWKFNTTVKRGDSYFRKHFEGYGADDLYYLERKVLYTVAVLNLDPPQLTNELADATYCHIVNCDGLLKSPDFANIVRGSNTIEFLAIKDTHGAITPKDFARFCLDILPCKDLQVQFYGCPNIDKGFASKFSKKMQKADDRQIDLHQAQQSNRVPSVMSTIVEKECRIKSLEDDIRFYGGHVGEFYDPIAKNRSYSNNSEIGSNARVIWNDENAGTKLVEEIVTDYSYSEADRSELVMDCKQEINDLIAEIKEAKEWLSLNSHEEWKRCGSREREAECDSAEKELLDFLQAAI